MDQMGKRAKALLLLLVLLAGGWSVFAAEYAVYGEKWALAEGNPHGRRGIVTDRNGILLRDLGKELYPEHEVLRQATAHWVGDRDGNIHTPVLDHFKSQLLGYGPLTGLYSFSGQNLATMTISAQVQITALEAMEGRRGVVAVYNYKTGAVLCALSASGHDEGRYLNRFLQGVYTPGSVFKIVTAAAALHYIEDILDQEFSCTGKVEYKNGVVTCERVHGKLDLYGAMRESCNCVFARISQQLGAEKLQRFAAQCGITEALDFDGAVSAKGKIAPGRGAELAWAGIGQHEDLVNPASFLAFLGTVANGGQGYRPYIMERITEDGSTVYQAKPGKDDRKISGAVAAELKKILRGNVKNNYGDGHFPGLQVCAKTGTAQVGGGKKATALLAGFAENYPLAFVVIVEEGGYGRAACIPIAAKVLAACKKEMDKSE